MCAGGEGGVEVAGDFVADLGAVFGALPQAVVVADAGGRVRAANSAVGDLLGWSAESLVGRPAAQLVVAADEAAVEAAIRRFADAAVAPGPATLARVGARRTDGTEVPVDVTLAGCDGPGRLVVATLQDARPRLLAEAAASLAGAPTLDAALERLARSATLFLAEVCVIDIVGHAGRIERRAVSFASGRAPVHALRAHPPEAGSNHPAAEVIRTGRSRWSPVLSDDEARGWARSSEHLEALRGLGECGYLSVPLLADRRVVGALTLVTSGRTFGAADVVPAEQLAAQAAEVLAATSRADADHRLASDLQRMLLPPELPRQDGLELAVRYTTADAAAAAGGDFYDAMVLPSRRLGLVVGDVEGHDPTAAATMGQLRSALRALAGQQREPVAVLDALRWSWPLLGFDRMATLCVARIDPADGTAVLLSAGHPPPVVMRAGGRVEVVELRPLPALGAPPGPGREVTIQLDPDDVLLLYTDGLIERRDRSWEASVDLLVQACAGARSTDLEQFCDRLLSAMGPPGEDDVALLAVRRTGG
jgi:PAS domain S-box-containing protein